MELTEEMILREICRKEIENELYDIKIHNVPIYHFVRRYVRERIMREKGLNVMNSTTVKHKMAIVRSVFISFFQLCKLFVCHKKCPTLFFSFPRIDKVGDEYIDKFTDPIIDLCFGDDYYMILDHALGGRHVNNRVHKERIVYSEFLDVSEDIIAKLFYKFYMRKHHNNIERLIQKMEKGFGVSFNTNEIAKLIFYSTVITKFMEILFRYLSVERIIGPSRDYLTAIWLAARKLGIKAFELQHGVTYGETVMYSGYREELFMPDFFLAYGDNKPAHVYGIDENRIVNVGWALQDYISKLPKKKKYDRNDILVVSDPEITDSIFEVIIQLAKEIPQCTFYFRPHPHETITEHHMILIKDIDNIRIQDKRINISVVLQDFIHIIGENSTVLYEALAMNRKVGKLFYKGLNPKYLLPEDKESFWEIRNQSDFESFLDEDISTKKSKCIYSPFNKELFCKVIGI